ncbi:histidine phosphatase family protein [uncultured Tessaracoccus sp.]|uniref:histidine phosphatase family protein n=1 Tax=uncultured Tessaracoccus sp. TaxID=905023 RepID=UPI0025F785CD|nr:histidine phosphatase family protein [uncultured Tessaracoccus sp.]
MTVSTTLHVLRHGQVHNPEGLLYGRLPGFGLSELGHRMAERMAEHFADVELTHLRCSPLQRARETMRPTEAQHPELDCVVDDRLIEAANVFEGKVFGEHNRALFDPRMAWHVRNPLRPSWGEPYRSIAARMLAAFADAARAAGPGGTALLVSHQLPIYIARRAVEGRSFVHDPRRRGTTLCSVTTFTYVDGLPVGVRYAEPVADLLPESTTARKFRVGT